MKKVLTILLSIIVGVQLAQNVQAGMPHVGYIYIGDSRFVGMEQQTKFTNDSNVWNVAKVGQGLRWLKKDAISQVDAIEKQNSQIDIWYEIYGLGVNDLGNSTDYVRWYQDRAIDHNVVVVSVNPVENYPTVSNKTIESFNTMMKTNGLNFINTYSALYNLTGKTTDGLHYNKETYKKIYEMISTSVKYGFE